jgi:hypothetical protein
MTLKSNIRFALRKESLDERGEVPLNNIELLGNYLSWFAFEFRHFSVKIALDPRFLTVILTGLALTLNSLIFYPTATWNIIYDACLWIFRHVNWSYFRFALWILSEITIFGLGIRAFGRFSNKSLMARYFN